VRHEVKNSRRSLLFGNRGASRFKTLLIIIVIAAIGYAAYKVGVPYYQWLKIKSEVKEIAIDFRNKPLVQINREIKKRAKKVSNDPLKGEIDVKRKGNITTITMDYDVNVVFVPEKLEHVFSFHIEESNM
jgi:hypothetical protein